MALRGISGYQRTAVLVDNQPMNNALSGGVNWASFEIEDIDRIEVVPGPFSSLYGGSAMGGVINIITKKPEEGKFVVKAGVGSNALNSLSLTYGGKTFEDLGRCANYGHKRSDGYIREYVVKGASSGAGVIPVTG